MNGSSHWRAITRAPGPELVQCELTHLQREPIDVHRAIAQHRAYESVLQNLGLDLISLPSDPQFADGVFVEDTVVVLDEAAIITCPTPRSRRGEVDSIAEAIEPFRRTIRLPSGAHLEGGDVLRVGRKIFVGHSQRTNELGIQALASIAQPLGYDVIAVEVRGCLHLKSAVTALNDETLLANRDWIDDQAFKDYAMIDVPQFEPWGANVLRLQNGLLMSSAFPLTIEQVVSHGYKATVLDVSELHKAESGLTCMSVPFRVDV